MRASLGLGANASPSGVAVERQDGAREQDRTICSISADGISPGGALLVETGWVIVTG